MRMELRRLGRACKRRGGRTPAGYDLRDLVEIACADESLSGSDSSEHGRLRVRQVEQFLFLTRAQLIFMLTSAIARLLSLEHLGVLP